MKKRRNIAWLLIAVCMVMLTATIVPHHHHNARLCVQHHEMSSCCPICQHEAQKDAAHKCDTSCITVFQSVKPNIDLTHISPQVFQLLPQLFLFQEIDSLFLNYEKLHDFPDFYLEGLHSIRILHSHGLRAPPCLHV